MRKIDGLWVGDFGLDWIDDIALYLMDGARGDAPGGDDFASAVNELRRVSRDYTMSWDVFMLKRLDTGDFSALKSLRTAQLTESSSGEFMKLKAECERSLCQIIELVRKRASRKSVGGAVHIAVGEAIDIAEQMYAFGRYYGERYLDIVPDTEQGKREFNELYSVSNAAISMAAAVRSSTEAIQQNPRYLIREVAMASVYADQLSPNDWNERKREIEMVSRSDLLRTIDECKIRIVRGKVSYLGYE